MGEYKRPMPLGFKLMTPVLPSLLAMDLFQLAEDNKLEADDGLGSTYGYRYVEVVEVGKKYRCLSVTRCRAEVWMDENEACRKSHGVGKQSNAAFPRAVCYDLC